MQESQEARTKKGGEAGPSPAPAEGGERPQRLGRRERVVRRAFWERDSYILLFGLLLVDYIMLLAVNSSRWGGLLRTVPIAATVVFALHTSEARRHLIVLARTVVVVTVALAVVQAILGSVTSVGNAVFIILFLLMAVTPVAILRRVLTHTKVDLQTVFAAVDVYILIGLIFGVLFQIMGTISWQVAHVKFLAQPTPPPPSSDYMYLSFVTLTTVGFGDITPYTSLARSVVVLEALMGQIFLVTLVARMVAMFGTERQPSAVGLRRQGRGASGHPDAGHDTEGAEAEWGEDSGAPRGSR